MGRDWYRLRGNGGGSGSGGGGRQVASSNTKKPTKSHENGYANSKYAASGCMASLFHFFDFHHFYFPSLHNQHPTIDPLQKSPEELVAPRNSLEMTDESPLSPTLNNVERLNITMGITRRTKLQALAMEKSSSSSEIGDSPGTKTPNLVARLMGLDLLPHHIDLNHSPPHKSPHHRPRSEISRHRLSFNENHTETRSLPETPRISSARRSDFDVHRLSLQLNKESKIEQAGRSRLKEMKNQDEEISRSPRDNNARQIVNQIKERVITRRVCMDITNSVKNREVKRNSSVSCSPRDRFPEKENKTRSRQKTTLFRPDQISQQQQQKLQRTSPRASEVKENVKKVKKQQQQQQQQQRPRCNKHSPTSNFRNKQEEGFSETTKNRNPKRFSPLDKKRCKLSVSSYVPVKKIQPPAATKFPQKQVNESKRLDRNSNSSILSNQSFKHAENLPDVARNLNSDDAATISPTTTTAEGSGIDFEHEYVTRVLNYAGIASTKSSVSSQMRLSHPSPIEPSIFRKLENSIQIPSGKLALQCNRKLLFDLTNETLTHILDPRTTRRRPYDISEIIGEINSSISKVSSTDSMVAEEIDALFTGNLLATRTVEEEGEVIVAEIERDLMHDLALETTSDLETMDDINAVV